MSQVKTYPDADEKTNFPAAKKFLQSKNVKVFPCAYRGQQIEGAGGVAAKVFDPESRGFTEYNYSNFYSAIRQSKRSYVISWDPGTGTARSTLKCVIGGYYFELYNLVPGEDFSNDECLAIARETVDLSNSDEDGLRETTILKSLGENESFYLDMAMTERNNNSDVTSYIFLGLSIVDKDDISTGGFDAYLQPFKHVNHYDTDGTTVLSTTIEVNTIAKRLTDSIDIGDGKFSLKTIGEIVNSEDNTCTASGDYSVAIGNNNTAKNYGDVVFGTDNRTGSDSDNKEDSYCSFVAGGWNLAKGIYTTVFGRSNEANADYQTILGKYNNPDENAALIIGWGSGVGTTAKKNIFTVKNVKNSSGTITEYGNVEMAGHLNLHGIITADKGINGNNTLTLGSTTNNDYGAIVVYGTGATPVFSVTKEGVITASSNLTTNGVLAVKGTITAQGGAEGNNGLTLGSTASDDYGSITVYGTGSAHVFKVEADGDTEIKGTLDVTKKLTVSNAFKATGNAEIGGTFKASGAATLSSGLNVTGNTSIAGSLSATGNNGTITASQSITGKALYINSIASISAEGEIIGAKSFTLKSGSTNVFTIDSTGNTVASGDMSAAKYKFGASVISEAGGNINLNKSASITGDIYQTGDIYIGTGDTYDKTTAKASITKEGVATFTGALSAGGNGTIGGTLEVTGVTTLKSNASVAGTLTVTGATTLSSTLGVTGAITSAGLTSSQKLDVTAGGAAIVGDTTVTGAFTATGIIKGASYDTNSDIRLKQNIKDYSCAKSILDLPVKEYEYINDETHRKHIGCIAQDLQQICPELVHEGTDGYLTIEESKLVYLLIKEVKELKEEIKALKGE